MVIPRIKVQALFHIPLPLSLSLTASTFHRPPYIHTLRISSHFNTPLLHISCVVYTWTLPLTRMSRSALFTLFYPVLSLDRHY